MNESYPKLIYNNLNARNTDDLLAIWQAGDPADWEEGVFEVIKEILAERLGYVPLQSDKTRALLHLKVAAQYLQNNELGKALKASTSAIKLDPALARAYDCRGVVYDEMGQLHRAITDFQKAIQLDPRSEAAWENMGIVEEEIEEEFRKSAVKRRLDKALEYANNDETKKALEACEAVKASLPKIALAHNYFGLIYQTADRLEAAIACYQKAIELNPRFWAARENLANARVLWEEEQYRSIKQLIRKDTKKGKSAIDKTQISPGNDPIPPWFYLDEKAFILPGWAGHRTRQDRSGFDPLDTDFELAHIQGVIIHQLFTGRIRPRNPVSLVLMFLLSSVFILPLLVLTVPYRPDWFMALLIFDWIVTSSPYWMTGIALLTSVILSTQLDGLEKIEIDH